MRDLYSQLLSTKDKNRQVFNSFLAATLTAVFVGLMVANINSIAWIITFGFIMVIYGLVWYFRIRRDMNPNQAFSFYVNYITGAFVSVVTAFMFFPMNISVLAKIIIVCIATAILLGISMIIVSYTKKNLKIED